ncbi:sporulation protein [Streptomyces griseorubiginosus]|uniref:sporulation protein n=1 Tax=Streptomyces griseorubiginosus TaxID=67304 RepID=UPI0036E983D1
MDTRILGPALPGGELRGEVLLRGGPRETYVDHLGRGAAADLRGAAALETPLSELGGRALGVALSVKSRIARGDDGDGIEVDDDLLHVSALPLHEAVLDLFAEEGCLCDAADVVEGDVPGTEQRLGIIQTFRLTGHSPDPDRPDALEVTFQTNAVGAMVHVRRAAPDERYWEDKPPARRLPAAHHEVGTVDLRPRVGKVLSELALLDDR